MEYYKHIIILTIMKYVKQFVVEIQVQCPGEHC